MKRDVGIELYRCLLMLGIVSLHTFCCAGYGFSPFCRWIMFCVDGFVFISGWYGIKFGWRKVVNLYALALTCAALYACISPCVCGGWVRGILKAAEGYWFINSYVMLMCVAPLINEGLERLRGEGAGRVVACVGPLLVAIFGWSFLCEVPVVKEYVPFNSGFGSHTFLTLLGVYVVARVARQFELDKKITTRQLWVALGVLSFLAFLNLNKYNSPVAVLMGMTCFLLMKRLPWGEGCVAKKIGGVILAVSPCMLSVYLLHSCRSDFALVRRLLAIWEDPLVGAILTTVIVFCGAIVIDLIRRLLISPFRRFL